MAHLSISFAITNEGGGCPLTGADPSFALYSEPLIGSDRSHDFEMRGPGVPLPGGPLMGRDPSFNLAMGIRCHEEIGGPLLGGDPRSPHLCISQSEAQNREQMRGPSLAD